MSNKKHTYELKHANTANLRTENVLGKWLKKINILYVKDDCRTKSVSKDTESLHVSKIKYPPIKQRSANKHEANIKTSLFIMPSLLDTKGLVGLNVVLVLTSIASFLQWMNQLEEQQPQEKQQ